MRKAKLRTDIYSPGDVPVAFVKDGHIVVCPNDSSMEEFEAFRAGWLACYEYLKLDEGVV